MCERKPDGHAQALLQAGSDPNPVELINPDADTPLTLVCEHAGRAIPKRLDNLGLPEEALELHIAYDIGAEQVANGLAAHFGCTLLRQRYSRLVIDCNRPPGTDQSIPETSDSIAIPGNLKLSGSARTRRECEIFAPYARQCSDLIQRPNLRFVCSIHSFTPQMNGVSRPWDIGFLFRHPSSRGETLVEISRSLWPDLEIGCNAPYRIEDPTDWFIPVCAEPRGIPHCLIEIRNDHLLTPDGCEAWADRLHRLISKFMEQTDA